MVKKRKPMIFTQVDLKQQYSEAFPLIENMLEMQPKNRPTAQNLLESRFFNAAAL